MGHRRAPGADNDLDRIWLHVAQESGSFEIADRLTDSITERFYLLSENPYMGRPRNDLRPGLRSFPVGQYVIVYRVENDDVLILHVFHGRQDIQAFFRH